MSINIQNNHSDCILCAGYLRKNFQCLNFACIINYSLCLVSDILANWQSCQLFDIVLEYNVV